MIRAGTALALTRQPTPERELLDATAETPLIGLMDSCCSPAKPVRSCPDPCWSPGTPLGLSQYAQRMMTSDEPLRHYATLAASTGMPSRLLLPSAQFRDRGTVIPYPVLPVVAGYGGTSLSRISASEVPPASGPRNESAGRLPERPAPLR